MRRSLHVTTLLLCFLYPTVSWAISCTGTSYPFDTPTDPQAQSHTFPTITNGIAFVHVAERSASRSVQGTPTIGGVSTTRIETKQSSTAQAGELFYLLAPGSGSLSVSVDWDAVPLTYVLTVVTCDDVHQSSPIYDSNVATGASGTTITVDCTSAVGQLVVDFAAADTNSTLTTGAGQTNIDQDSADGGALVAGSSYEDGAATVTMSHTITDDDWSTFCVALNVASGISGFSRRR